MANTGNIFIDVMAIRSWLDVGKDRNITYYFDEGSPSHLWTTFEKAIYRAALQEWANVANITFQEVSSPAGADLFETWVTPAFITQTWGPSTSGGTWAAVQLFSASEWQCHRACGISTACLRFFRKAHFSPAAPVTTFSFTKLVTGSGSRIRMGPVQLTRRARVSRRRPTR